MSPLDSLSLNFLSIHKTQLLSGLASLRKGTTGGIFYKFKTGYSILWVNGGAGAGLMDVRKLRFTKLPQRPSLVNQQTGAIKSAHCQKLSFALV